MKIMFTQHNVRCTLKSSSSAANLTWLFIPGGAGIDSSCFDSLLAELPPLPGKVYFLDFPGNGNHLIPNTDFDNWLSIFIPTISQFENPIIVGHSFGGMFPYLFPECEKILAGFVSLNSAPKLWMEAAVRFAKDHALPDLTHQMEAFITHPSQETFEEALEACMPYYFPSSTLEKGKQLLRSIPFPYQPAVWWQKKAMELPYIAQWIPQHIPTMIMGGTHDAICPYWLYQEDTRFDRPNIQKVLIEGGGHCPWVEKPKDVKAAFKEFIARLTGGSSPSS